MVDDHLVSNASAIRRSGAAIRDFARCSKHPELPLRVRPSWPVTAKDNGLSATRVFSVWRNELLLRNEGIRKKGKDLADAVKLLASPRRHAIALQSAAHRAYP